MGEAGPLSRIWGWAHHPGWWGCAIPLVTVTRVGVGQRSRSEPVRLNSKTCSNNWATDSLLVLGCGEDRGSGRTLSGASVMVHSGHLPLSQAFSVFCRVFCKGSPSLPSHQVAWAVSPIASVGLQGEGRAGGAGGHLANQEDHGVQTQY